MHLLSYLVWCKSTVSNPFSRKTSITNYISSISNNYCVFLVDPNDILIAMKHIFYHLTAVMVVVVWGMTFISTKVLIVHGLSPQEIFLFRFLLAYVAVCPISSHSFFARNLKDELCLAGGGVLGGSLFFFLQNMALGLTQASNVSFIICTAPLLTAVLTVLSVRTEKVSRGFIYGSIVALLGVGLLIFNGSFILRISPLGDLLTLLASLSWAFYSLVIRSLTRKYSPAFITRKYFLWHNNNSAHFPFSAFIDKACCIAGQWSVEQSPFFRCHSFVCLLSVVEYCRKTTGDDTGIQLSLSESSCHNGWGDYIPTWGGDPSRDRRNRLGSLGCISGYQKLPSSKQYCYKKASGLSSVYFIITIIICRPHLVINLRFKQCFSFSSHQENTPFYLFLNETIDNHRFE